MPSRKARRLTITCCTGEKNNPYLKATEWNWQINPLGFRTIITRYANDWRMPVFPIENGIGVIE